MNDYSAMNIESLKNLLTENKIDHSDTKSNSELVKLANSISMPINYKTMTVEQLKNICRTRGLKVGGKKADLIERLSGKKETAGMTIANDDSLSLLKVKDLKEICKSLSLTCTGKKDEIIERIKNCKNNDKDNVISIFSGKTKKKKLTKTQLKPYEERTKALIKRLNKKKQIRNKKLYIKFDDTIKRYTDKNTGFIFNDTENIVEGRYVDGLLKTLNDADMDICKELRLKYRIPTTIRVDDDIHKECDIEEIPLDIIEEDGKENDENEEENNEEENEDDGEGGDDGGDEFED